MAEQFLSARSPFSLKPSRQRGTGQLFSLHLARAEQLQLLSLNASVPYPGTWRQESQTPALMAAPHCCTTGGKMSKTSVSQFPWLILPLPTAQAGVCKHLERWAGFSQELREVRHPHLTAVQGKASVQLFPSVSFSPTAPCSTGQSSAPGKKGELWAG